MATDVPNRLVTECSACEEVTAKASIIIPAHNESAVIERTLRPLLPLLDQGFEIIVGCNGCVDDTATRARQCSSEITVLETSNKGKHEGLNLADQAASGQYRMYVDADIRLESNALPTLLSAMERTACLAAAPTFRVDLSQSSWAVRQFYDVWVSLPYFTSGTTIGSGIYALSAEGRRRFSCFPNIIADDAYVRSLFQRHEILIADDCWFTVTAPRNLGSLIKIKTRSRLGNMQLRMEYPQQTAGGDNTAALLTETLKRPQRWASLGVYTYVQTRTLLRARRQFKHRIFKNWERDETSRN
jgi:glycosyltransferase involved in cell wall biosynthesis